VKLGDLVVWVGEIDTSYKGKVGMVIDFCPMKNPEVLYPDGKIVRFAHKALEIVSC
jgi:hypothetical protein